MSVKHLEQIPAVDKVLEIPEIKDLISQYGHGLVVFTIREVIDEVRKEVLEGKKTISLVPLVTAVNQRVRQFDSASIKPVINGTGVVLHTNLGRAPLGNKILKDIEKIITGYSNLELDVKKAVRGKRNQHIAPLLRFITGAQDALVVNNNAAGLILTLHSLAKGKEVIISRGELVEIGDSFRIPEILAASGAVMKEVGATNKTYLADYENAVNENTGLILKVHKSNYVIKGFSQEVTLKELSKHPALKHIPVVYDIGSGLLRKPAGLPLTDEPDVRTAIKDGADLVTFSGDKLLGGPQSGIVAGKRQLISQLSKAPMMRALRVGKLTIAALSSAVRCYLNDAALKESLPLFGMLEQSKEQLQQKATLLLKLLIGTGVKAKMVNSKGQCGGGTLPLLEIDSFAVNIVSEAGTKKQRGLFAEQVYRKLLNLELPILGILRQGEFFLDILTVQESDFSYIVTALSEVTSAG